jgi:hypothetical protein
MSNVLMYEKIFKYLIKISNIHFKSRMKRHKITTLVHQTERCNEKPDPSFTLLLS